MSGFTKGPWDLGGGESGGSATIVYSDDATGSAIAELQFSHVRRHAQEVRANGHLIAAAPEMYEALKAIASGEGLQPGQTLERILAKAEGKS